MFFGSSTLRSYFNFLDLEFQQKYLFKFLTNLCLAQIRFVINVPKQVTKPKGYVATLITLVDLDNKIMNRKRPILRVRSTFHCLA